MFQNPARYITFSGFVLAITLVCASLVRADEQAKVLDLVTKSIAANQQNLKNIRCAYDLTILDPAINEMVLIRQTQAFTKKEFRFESFEGKLKTQSLCFRDGVWHRFLPEAKIYEIKHAEGMPSTLPIDPREFGVFDTHKTLVAKLKAGKTLQAEFLKNEVTPIALIRIEEHREGNNVITLNFQLDSRFRYLPVLVTQKVNDDFNASIELQYKLLDDTCWIPESAVYKYYKAGSKELSKASFHQKVEQRLTEVKTQQSFEQNFFSDAIPKGTTVNDSIRNIDFEQE